MAVLDMAVATVIQQCGDCDYDCNCGCDYRCASESDSSHDHVCGTT